MPVIRSRALSWFAVLVGAALTALGLLNLIVNTGSVASWLPLVVLMPVVLATGVRGLRATAPTP